ncbi:DUF2628 domain-containing protein [Rhodoblastus sp.]|uniref:DUF2628 domain-containing protein n=1 Tax=Rhodoblastus sp. TaxID=1962975 RepID=UPI003F9ACB19
MQIYAVYLPSGLSPLQVAEEAVLVRQGFDWKASLLTPGWALWHGLWLALALWLAWTSLVAIIGALAHLQPGATLFIYLVGALGFGLEADRFHQARLSRSGYLLQGLALGESIGEAESLYFNRRRDRPQVIAPSAPAKPAIAPGDRLGSPTQNIGADLLGLFPPQETKR